jgi:hypothetical protein
LAFTGGTGRKLMAVPGVDGRDQHGQLSMSWALTVVLRRIPVVARMI